TIAHRLLLAPCFLHAASRTVISPLSYTTLFRSLESVGGDTFSLVYTRRFERLAEDFFPVPSLSVQPGDYDADRLRINLTSSIARSEEHTSELQSRENLVCRLLLEKKNAKTRTVA